jgi:hypothetical protein
MDLVRFQRAAHPQRRRRADVLLLVAELGRGSVAVQCGERLVELAEIAPLTAHACHDGTPRSVRSTCMPFG